MTARPHHAITPGGFRAVPGRLFAAALPAVLRGTGEVPEGLVLIVLPSSEATAADGEHAADVTIKVGTPWGVEAERSITLWPGSTWLSVAGWRSIDVTIDAVAGDASVGFAWTTTRPPSLRPARLVREIVAGADQVIPAGATKVALSNADAGWSFTTRIGADVRTVTAPQVGGGEEAPVLGSLFSASVPNVAVWTIEGV